MPRKLIYDVAVSIDGFIAGPGGEVDGFLFEGDHVADYQTRLAGYGAVVMGRGTYEAGYAYGMAPGAAPYGDKPHYVMSRNLTLPEGSAVQVVREDWLGAVDRLKAEDGGDIYLCGGGTLAGHLLKHGRIDRVILKINPVALGRGVALFDTDYAAVKLSLVAQRACQSGVILAEYAA